MSRYQVRRDGDKFIVYKRVLDTDLYIPIDYEGAMGLIDLDFAIRRELDAYEVVRKTPLPKFLECMDA